MAKRSSRLAHPPDATTATGRGSESIQNPPNDPAGEARVSNEESGHPRSTAAPLSEGQPSASETPRAGRRTRAAARAATSAAAPTEDTAATASVLGDATAIASV